MEAFLAGLDYTTFPSYALLAMVVVLLLTGRINPKSIADALKVERDDWKTAYFESEKTNRVLTSQNSELLEVAKTVNHIIRSLPRLGSDNELS